VTITMLEHSILQVISPTSPCSTLSALAEPACKHTEILFYAMRHIIKPRVH